MQSIYVCRTVAKAQFSLARRTVVVKASAAPGPVNPNIKKDQEKVADIVKVSELPKGKVRFHCYVTISQQNPNTI